MAINSLGFLFLLLPVTVSGYWLLIRLGRQNTSLLWLLIASIAFYICASPWSLAVLFPSILFDYGISKLALSLDASRTKARTALIAVGIIANILFLSYFKYSNFFLETASTILGGKTRLESLLLPIGISFLTFQKIAFLHDVHSGRVTSIRLLDFLQFTLFFSRTTAGPIVHYNELIPQLYQTRRSSMSYDIAVGFCLIAIGLFKKCLVGDGVAQYVSLAFGKEPADSVLGPLTLPNAWFGVLAYTLQLYFDFSGYSDMALGTARMVGVRLPMNFNSPYQAASMVEFWSRWHITLTRFLTWHIYIPLVRRLTRTRAARRQPLLRGPNSRYSAVLSLIAVPTTITMLVSGVWHGVGWQFVIWGALHGFYLTVNQSWKLLRPRFWANQASYDHIMRPVGRLLTFLCVMLALVFFRSSTISDAFTILGSMIGLHGVIPRVFLQARQAGFDLDWVHLAEPLEPLPWILLLLTMVMFLPNSLELLRRFRPALDFPPNTPEPPVEMPAEQAEVASMPAQASGILQKLHQLRSICKDFAKDGISFDRRTAVVISILFVLSAMAIGRGGGFLYGGY